MSSYDATPGSAVTGCHDGSASGVSASSDRSATMLPIRSISPSTSSARPTIEEQNRSSVASSSANAVIAGNAHRHPKRLRTENPEGPPLDLYEHEDETLEATRQILASADRLQQRYREAWTRLPHSGGSASRREDQGPEPKRWSVIQPEIDREPSEVVVGWDGAEQLRAGDRVALGEVRGEVLRLRLTHIDLRVEDGSIVFIPNRLFRSNVVKVERKRKVWPVSVKLNGKFSTEHIERLRIAAILCPFRSQHTDVAVEHGATSLAGVDGVWVKLSCWSEAGAQAAVHYIEQLASTGPAD